MDPMVLNPKKDKITLTAEKMVFFTSEGISNNKGLTSTKSSALSLPVSWSTFPICMISGKVRPPSTGVPVLGANHGSTESMSTLQWIGRREPLKNLIKDYLKFYNNNKAIKNIT